MQKKVAGEKETTPGSVDLNQMIPLFLAASEERRAEAFAVLRGDRKDEDEQPRRLLESRQGGNFAVLALLFYRVQSVRLRVEPTVFRL